MTTVKVTSSAELPDALATADDIEVDGSLAGMPMITLPTTAFAALTTAAAS